MLEGEQAEDAHDGRLIRGSPTCPRSPAPEEAPTRMCGQALPRRAAQWPCPGPFLDTSFSLPRTEEARSDAPSHPPSSRLPALQEFLWHEHLRVLPHLRVMAYGPKSVVPFGIIQPPIWQVSEDICRRSKGGMGCFRNVSFNTAWRYGRRGMSELLTHRSNPTTLSSFTKTRF